MGSINLITCIKDLQPSLKFIFYSSVEVYGNNKQMNVVIVRLFCFTGPRRGYNFSISLDAYQIAKIIKNKQEKVLRIGNLDTVRAVTDVRDIANAFFLL
jgi:GDP-4-dehydro-6-deoxy-D-mannose reductase